MKDGYSHVGNQLSVLFNECFGAIIVAGVAGGGGLYLLSFCAIPVAPIEMAQIIETDDPFTLFDNATRNAF